MSQTFEQKAAALRRRINATAQEIKSVHEKAKRVSTDPQQINSFKAAFRSLERYFLKFEDCWEELHDIHDVAGVDYPLESDNHTKLRIKSWYNEAKIIYENVSESEQSNKENRTISNVTMLESTAHKLPTIELPHFNGELKGWPKFRDTFTSLVHNEQALTQIQKFHYLQSSITGQASVIISHLELNEENYLLAWNTLVAAFDNVRLLAGNYLKDILTVEKPNSKSQLNNLKWFRAKIIDRISAFKLLNIEDESNFILFFLAKRMLDTTTKEQFEIAHSKDKFPTFDQLKTFVNERCLALELADEENDSTPNPSGSNPSKTTQNKTWRTKTSLVAVKPNNKPTHKPAHDDTSSLPTCFICQEGNHFLGRCNTFKSATLEEREKLLANWQGCRNCLASNHQVQKCASKWKCRFCNRRHHSLLHRVSSNYPSNNSDTYKPNVKSDSPSTSVLSATTNRNMVLLGTASAEVTDKKGRIHTIRLVFDSGSQNCFITQELCQKLGLKWTPTKLHISGIGEMSLSDVKGRTECTFNPIGQRMNKIQMQAFVVRQITSDLPNCSLPINLKLKYKGFQLADQDFHIPRKIDVLIGADLYPDLITGAPKNVGVGIPKILPTVLGDVIIGKLDLLAQGNVPLFSGISTQSTLELNNTIRKFWEIEEVPKCKSEFSEDELMCEEFFRHTTERTVEGRYTVRLPFKGPIPSFPGTLALASKRYDNLQAKLNKNLDFKNKYEEFMSEYADLGHMSQTESSSNYIIPHHAVVKSHDPSSKLRVVFDASAKAYRSSLNDHLHIGPKLQTDISVVLLNFRRHAFVFVTDIVKMFRNILVNPEDRRYQHILWKPKGSDSVLKYELNTVTYGLACSPYLALRVLKQLIQDEGELFPKAASIVSSDIYVDDIVTGCDSSDELLQLQNDLINLMSKGGFQLGKWASNCLEVLINVAEANSQPWVPSSEDAPNVKILGLQWDPKVDSFSFSLHNITCDYPFTKRLILSTVSRIFDPIGFLSPVIFKLKQFIQLLWKENLDWDDILPKALEDKWYQVYQTLPHLSQIYIPRSLQLCNCERVQLIGFCDASEAGYCAAIYVKVISNNKCTVSLLTAKTKLAPLKTISVPRLELCGAHLLSRLYNSIKNFEESLKPPKLPTTFFTDSTIVLGWLRTPPYKLKTFVANRISDIITNTNVESWRHVSSAENPSDCGSRGILPVDLVSHPLWWSGPSWLQKDQNEWPTPLDVPTRLLPELKVHSLFSSTGDSGLITWMGTLSSFSRIIRTVAWMLRFCDKCQRKSAINSSYLTAAEVDRALIYCVKLVQKHYFFKNDMDRNLPLVRKTFNKLSPFVDEHGVLRVGGRLEYADVTSNQKHPFLLPNKCHFTKLLTQYYHRVHLHPGPTLLQSIIQLKFWIPSLRRLSKQICYECVKCYRLRNNTFAPQMANLPKYRLDGGRAFAHTGIDFAGPIMCRETLRRKSPQYKTYICVFICMVTKALHIEIVTQLSTASFLAALQRFISRRGTPSNLYSDNGTNFVGAAKHLKELYKWFKCDTSKQEIYNFISSHNIEWHFNPPSAPHFGGLWEANIKSIKSLMKRTIGDTVLTYEEASTLYTRIEAILNSRPLCPTSSCPDDIDYLSPGHFLIGRPLVSPPEKSLFDVKSNLLTRWQLVQKMTQQIWRKWSQQYLSTLQQRQKWTSKLANPKVDDLVILKDDNVPILQWPIARIVSVHPGKDGVVRVATIRTPRGQYVRPLLKLAPLPNSS